MSAEIIEFPTNLVVQERIADVEFDKQFDELEQNAKKLLAVSDQLIAETEDILATVNSCAAKAK